MHNTLTEENIKKLREELDYRMTVKRAEIAKEKLIGAAHGDRSENAEYPISLKYDFYSYCC